MGKNKGSKSKKGASVDDIFEMLTGDGKHLPGNVDIFNGAFDVDGKTHKIAYVGAEKENGEVVAVALLLDQKTRDLLDVLLESKREEQEEDEEDEDSDDEDEDEGPEPFAP